MSGRLDQTELAGIRWLLGQLLVLVSLTGTYAIDLGAGLLVTALLPVVILATLLPAWVARVPSAFWRIAPGILLTGIVADFILSGGDVLPPLFRMVILLTVYRALQMRRPREDLQLLLLTLFLILLTGVLSLEITFGLQILLYAPAAMGLLFAANLSRPETDSQNPRSDPVFYTGGWRRLLGRMGDRLDRRTLGAGVALFAMTSSLALLLFILMPRFDIGAALPFPRLQTSSSLTGFTDHVRYGDVVSILNDDTIAMRVDVEMESPPARPYWRMVVLDAYYDGGFRVSPEVGREHRTISHYRFDFTNIGFEKSGEDSEWTLYLEGGVSAYLPTGDTFDTLRFKNRIDLQLHDLTRVLKTRETNATTLSLRYEGLEFGGSLPLGEEDRGLLGMKRRFVETGDAGYLEENGYPETLMVVPAGEANRRILEKAIGRIGSPRGRSGPEYARMITAFLRDGRGYSLESRIPDGQADRLLRWVDSATPGHCELYAGALVLISRYAGFPARLVTGFAGGDWNGYENYFMVRNRHAHAWCEVFDPLNGWVRVDPTPGYGADAGDVETALSQGRMRLDRTWQAWVDSLRVLWFRRVIQFDSADQALMAEAVKGAGLRGVDWLKERLEGWRDVFKGEWKERLTGEGGPRFVLDILMPVLLVAGAAVVIILIHRLRFRRDFEARIRHAAGRILRQAGEKADREAPAYRSLLVLRYGPATEWPPRPEVVLKQIRKGGGALERR